MAALTDLTDLVVRMDGVSVRRGPSTLLRDVDWAVEVDERWVVLGPNGAGKTTLLRLAAAELHPSGGTVHMLGERMGRSTCSSCARGSGCARPRWVSGCRATSWCATPIGVAAVPVGSCTAPHAGVPELERLARTIDSWRGELLAYFDTDGSVAAALRAHPPSTVSEHREPTPSQSAGSAPCAANASTTS